MGRNATRGEFLRSLSHELRTPVGSLLMLSELLLENPEGNLTEKQVQFARAIHTSGVDVIALLDQVLAFAKIDCGALPIEVRDCTLAEVLSPLERKNVRVEQVGVVPQSLRTDAKRLVQVLSHFSSLRVAHTGDAFVFTATGNAGIGLFVAQELVVLLGGEMTVDGSTHTLHLPDGRHDG